MTSYYTFCCYINLQADSIIDLLQILHVLFAPIGTRLELATDDQQQEINYSKQK